MSDFPENYLWSGVSSGVKKSSRPDLGVVYSSYPSTVAGVFTSNNLPAAPVVHAREKLESSSSFRGLVVNSGVANAATGQAGRKDDREYVRQTADLLNLEPDEVLSASTGYIGRRLPMKNISAHLPDAVDELKEDPADFSEAILTTDSYTKTAEYKVDDIDATVFGVAKGSGMINPRLATMLAFVFVDYPVVSDWWQEQLEVACGNSFNQITVDGDTSTNDTVLAWAADLPDPEPVDGSHPASDALSSGLKEVCSSLADQIVEDGEGATCTIEVRVAGAADDSAAERVASEIAGSPLVRTAFYAREPNWGRIYSSVGAAGPRVDVEKIILKINGFTVFKAGDPVFERGDLRRRLEDQDKHCVEVDLGVGSGVARRVTCDLSEKYVEINAGYG